MLMSGWRIEWRTPQKSFSTRAPPTWQLAQAVAISQTVRSLLARKSVTAVSPE
jgi:hypothetical protein